MDVQGERSLLFIAARGGRARVWEVWWRSEGIGWPRCGLWESRRASRALAFVQMRACLLLFAHSLPTLA